MVPHRSIFTGVGVALVTLFDDEEASLQGPPRAPSVFRQFVERVHVAGAQTLPLVCVGLGLFTAWRRRRR